ncbi:LTA synthase family protein [Lachnoclostridium sp. An181]|uniref:LTA synthase family protein n=1 Tax=Lachnoclostridium sp. An181 TaxID=1965575 RepID=UPI000B3989E9|nr:LTA synthase family protein [Lachnoclostridium sp. An181]OUP49115.1 hypothetical protein B5F18_09300 [Lachnoclostridium sp. An181]
MKHIHIKKPNIKGSLQKLRHLKREDIKRHFRERKERRERILEARRNTAFAKKMQKVYKIMNRISLILHFVLACLLNFVIEVISRHSFFKAWDYMTKSPWVFLYNAFFIFVTFSIVYLVRRRVFTRIIISVIWLAIGVCNGYMLLKRVTPFNAQDLKTWKEGLSLFTNYFSVQELITLAVGLVAVIIWVIAMWRRGGQYKGKMHRILALVGVFVWFGLYSFVTKAAVDNRVISTYFGNIAFAYEDYGLPYCFSTSLFNTGINEPNGYGKETMERISQNGKLTSQGEFPEETPNIIFVQLESFFDPSEAEFFETSKDPIPNLRKMFKEYSSGYFKVPSVGAGTANTEFEVLTGMNLRYFGPGEYPYKTVLKDNSCESAASALKSLGYGTHAIHNNGGNFYSRAKVFNHIGFDSFTSKEFMNILQYTENGWAKDDILVDCILDSMNTTKQQDFVFCVSVQGHGEYPTEQILENPEIKVTGIEDEGLKNKWEYYVNQVYEMDAFAGRLISEIEKRDEPTVVVFYGDHLPTMGLSVKDLKSRYLYNTNYVIWDNIGLKKENRNIPSYQIMADVFDRLDIHTGTVFNYHQDRRKTKDYLSDLELLQYDILYGKEYVYDEKSPDIGNYMQMGVKDVSLNSIVPEMDGSYSLYGENFTKSSKVYVNGEKQSAKFLNNTRIELEDITLNEGDVISIKQVGSSNTVFRSSKNYLYQNNALVEKPDDEWNSKLEENNAKPPEERISWEDMYPR